jgi:hypothetical protein
VKYAVISPPGDSVAPTRTGELVSLARRTLAALGAHGRVVCVPVQPRTWASLSTAAPLLGSATGPLTRRNATMVDSRATRPQSLGVGCPDGLHHPSSVGIGHSPRDAGAGSSLIFRFSRHLRSGDGASQTSREITRTPQWRSSSSGSTLPGRLQILPQSDQEGSKIGKTFRLTCCLPSKIPSLS